MMNLFWAFWFFVNAGFMVMHIKRKNWAITAVSLMGAICCVYNMK